MNRKQQIEASITALRNELHAITGPEDDAANAALVGKCFRCSNNYSVPKKASDYWWLYTKVTGASDGSLETFTFQDDKKGRLSVESRAYTMRQSVERYEEITSAAFAKAWAAMLARITKAGLDAAA